MSTWDAARIASRRPLHKPVSRIGDTPTMALLPHSRHKCRTTPDSHCGGCGYHVCSCPPKPKISNVSKPLPGLVV